MRRLAHSLRFALVAAALSFGADARAALDLRKLTDEAKGSVVLVTLFDAAGHEFASGSGFVVSVDGRIVTNHHVIEGADRATVTFPDGREVNIRGVLADDAKHDVALLQAEGGHYPPLAFADGPAVVGEEIAIIGSPLGLSTTVSSGIVSAVRAEGLKLKHADDDNKSEGWGLQVTAPISHGSSGSPILNADGRVVGVAVGMLTGGENLNFGVPVAFARALNDGAKPGAKPAPLTPRSGPWKNLAISLSVFALPVIAYAVWALVAKRRRRSPALRN